MLRRLCCLLLCLWFAVLPGRAEPAATNTRVMEVVKRTVGETGQSIIGLGSWVSGKKYGDPLKGGTSDHDLRLLLPQGTQPADALKQWQDVRGKLLTQLRKEFGSDADKILETVNLYPPAQLMTDVEGPADALEKFRKVGVSPKLSFKGKPLSIPADAAEGLYGAGATTWTQRYEEAAGRLVYKEGDTVYTGLTDLTHFTEGKGTYTTSGMANTARQWAEHAEEALHAGQGDKVAKYLERLERDIMKARDLQRFDIHGAGRDELHSLMQQLRAHPDQLESLETRLQSVLMRSKLESAVLENVERAGVTERAVLVGLLDNLDKSKGLAQALREAAEKVPPERVVNGIVALIAISEMSTAAGEKDPAKMLVAAAPWLAGVGPQILAQIAEATLAAAKDAGYALVANSQEPFDLLAGIYTAGGRPDPNGTRYTLDQLVAAYHDEAKLNSFVFALAQRAAARNAGEATARADQKVADAIMARCYPVILRAWRAKREALTGEYLALSDTLRIAAPLLRYGPHPAKAGAPVVITAVSSDKQFGSHRDRMLAILQILQGPGCTIAVDDRWEEGGKEGAASNERVYTYDTSGTHTVHLTETITAGGALPATDRLAFKVTLPAAVDVVTEGGPKQPDTSVSKAFLDSLHQTNCCRFSIDGKVPIEWLDGRTPPNQVGGVNYVYDEGAPAHPLVWKGNTFSLTYKDVSVEKLRRPDEKGYDKTMTHEVTLTGTFEPKTAMIVNIREIEIWSEEYIPVNLPPRGPPTSSRWVLDLRNVGPLGHEGKGVGKFTARLTGLTPEQATQHVLEMSDRDQWFKQHLGTGDPKVCKVDLLVEFSKR
jgi:hypothetical protein